MRENLSRKKSAYEEARELDRMHHKAINRAHDQEAPFSLIMTRDDGTLAFVVPNYVHRLQEARL